MSLHTTVSAVGDTIVVAVDGNVDLASIAVLHSDVTRAVRMHRGATLIVDLDAVSVLDDTALGILLGAAATARDDDGDLEVVCNNPALRSRLARTGFDRAVAVRATIA